MGFGGPKNTGTGCPGRILAVVAFLAIPPPVRAADVREDRAPVAAPLIVAVPQEASPDDQPLYMGSGMTAPQMTQKGCVAANVRLPEKLDAPLPSSVTVKFAVRTDGTPGAVEVLGEASPPALTEAIREAVSRCRWTPGLDAAGTPRAIWVLLPIRFDADGGQAASASASDRSARAPALGSVETAPRLLDPSCMQERWSREGGPFSIESGELRFKFIVNADGSVGAFSMVEGRNGAMSDMVERAVRGCAWAPARDREGNAMAVWVVLPMRFLDVNR